MQKPKNMTDTAENQGAPVAWAGPAEDVAGIPAAPEEIGAEPEPTREELKGEISLLKDGLAGRNADVRYLNRDLGRLEYRLSELERTPRPLYGMKERLSGALHRLAGLWRLKVESEKPKETADGNGALIPARDPIVPFVEEDGPRRIIAVTAFGLERAALLKVLDTVEAYCRKRDTTPVLLTDSDCFELFRERRMVFEYLPPGAQREAFAADLQWPLYFRRRLFLFRRKWRPAGIIAFGSPPPVADLEKLLTSDPESA